MAHPKTASELKLLKAVKKGNLIKVKELFNSNLTILKDKRYFDYQLIIEALSKPQIPLTKFLIEKGLRVYKKSQATKTALEYAVCLEDLDLIETLLAKGASPDILVTSRKNKNKTLFHLAIERNQLSTIKLFLSQFDAQAFDKQNLLHYAVEQNKIQVVEQLIEKGLSLKKKNEKNLTPFCVALLKENYNILDCLLSHYSVKNIVLHNYDDIAPAYIASMTGNLQIIKQFVDAGISIDRPSESNAGTWSCLDDFYGSTLLQIAVKCIKLEVVEFLLSQDADILVRNKSGSSAFHIAFEIKERGIWKNWQEFKDNNLIIDYILQAYMKFKLNPVNKNRLAHFQITCTQDKPKVIQHFLKLSAIINQPVDSQCHLYKDFTFLHLAAKFRWINTLELLLKNGADVKQTNFEGMTALHIAAKEPSLDGVRLLLQYGADITSLDSHGNSPVHLAYKKQNYAIIDLLLLVENVADSNPANTEGLSHFHIACTRNNLKVVKNFINNGVSVDNCVLAQTDDNVSAADLRGYSPLHFAVSRNRAKIVQLLLSCGANVNVQDSNGFSPLHIAYRYNHEMFGEFIENILNDLDESGKITQHFKSFTDMTEIYEDFSREFDGSIGKINWTSNQNDHFKIINLLLNYGSDVNCIDNHGNSPVFYAYSAFSEIWCILESSLNCSVPLLTQLIEMSLEEMYKRRKLLLNNLLKFHVDLDRCCKHGSILNYIFSLYNEEADEFIELFLNSGANPNVINSKMMTPLHQATLMLNKSLIKMLLDHNAIVDCIYPENNSTPLLLATRPYLVHLDFDIINMFIDHGANVNARQSNGLTVLHNLASRKDSCYSDIDVIVCKLIKAGANVNSRDSNGFTPLHLACLIQNYNIVYVLLKYGGDVSIEDNQGRSVPCLMYDKHVAPYIWGSADIKKQLLILFLQKHVTSMRVIGLSISKKALLSQEDCENYFYRGWENRIVFTDDYKIEVQKLKDKRINGNYSLYNIMFKDDNALSKIVKNPTFKAIVWSKTFKQMYPNYGYLIQLKYQAGLDRIALFPKAKSLLNSLANQQLPDVCTEHICSYFTNVELKDSIDTLSNFLDYKAKSSDDNYMKLRIRRTNKHQKMN